jgi:hypothetical protein
LLEPPALWPAGADAIALLLWPLLIDLVVSIVKPMGGLFENLHPFIITFPIYKGIIKIDD